MARIALAEDDPRYRAHLVDTLRWVGGHEVVATFANGRTALLAAERLAALGQGGDWDLLVTDIEMPELDGIGLTGRVKAVSPELPVLVLTAFEDPPLVCDAIGAGADGYVLKTTPPEEIVEHVAVVLAGGSPLTPAVARHLLGRLRAALPPPARAPARPRPALTEREQDVLQCLVDGMAYKEAAAALGVSLDTVRTHIRGLYRKLQVQNAAGAVALAVRDRLVR